MGLIRNGAQLARAVLLGIVRPFVPYGLGWHWYRRIRLVMDSADNRHIPRVADAGKIIDGCQIMHNGLRILCGSYYGGPMTKLLELNRGVHEPQEERAFGAVLPLVPAGGTMLELGAYWSFYSMWFFREVKDAKCFMVEPEAENLKFGRDNFATNGMTGSFTQAFVGSSSGKTADGANRIGVDDFLAEHGIGHLSILHCDIQGHEMEMLAGAAKSLGARAVDYLFISTHSNELHHGCVDVLRKHGYRIAADSDLDDTYSFDGLIVACGAHISAPQALEISHRRGSR
jgi:hypothetical protein